MKELYDILSEFRTMKEYSDFMSTLVEKKADGNEISRGMNKHDKSKTQKGETQTFLSKQVKKKADGSSVEDHYSQHDPSMDQPPEAATPPPAAPLMPGQQVSIGKKSLDKAKTKPSTVNIELSGEADKLEMKPKIDKNPNNTP